MPSAFRRATFALVSFFALSLFSFSLLAQEIDPFGGGADPFGGAAPGPDPFGGGAPSDDRDPFDDRDDPFSEALPHKRSPRAVTIPPRVKRRAKGGGDELVEKALAQPTSMEFIETPLTNVADYIADLHGIDVQIDTRSLEDIGIGDDTPLTINLKGVSLRSALRLLLPDIDAEAIVHDGVLLITTPEAVEDLQKTKVYSIRHLLPADPLVDFRYAGEDVRDLVVSSIQPNMWEDVGGPGSIEVFRKSLVITATPRVHEDVSSLLTTLTAAQKIVQASKQTPPKITSLPQPPEWKLHIQKALRKNIDVDFREVPLQDVVDFLEEVADIQIQIDHRALEDVGLGSDTPVTRRVKDVSLHSFLQLTLKEMDLVYALRNEVLLITTPEMEESELQTRVFPVADLVSLWDEENEWLHAENWQAEGDYDSLIDLITTTIRPATWEDVGGPGAIEPWHGCLVFSQTRNTFAQIEHLLAGLRNVHAQLRAERDEPLTAAMKLDEFRFPSHAIIRETLQAEIGMLSFDEAPMADVMRQIGETHDVPIQLDYRALEDVGIDAGTPITATFGGESVGQALRRLTRPFELKVIIRDESIVITTPEEEESELLTCVYPVADLIVPHGKDGKPDPLAVADYDTLIDTITATVFPESWEDVGGPGSVEPYPVVQALVISQTEEVQDAIAELLASIREQEPAQGESEAAADDEEIVKNKHGERLYVKVYRIISIAHDDEGKPVAGKGPEEFATVIRELVEPQSWESDDSYYLRTLSAKGSVLGTGSIVVRHTAAAHHKIRKLLLELKALPESHFGLGGGLGGGQGSSGGGLGSGGLGGGGVFDVPDHVRGQVGGFCLGISGSIGYCGNGLRYHHPVVTMPDFSLPATDDHPALPLRIYDQRLVEHEEVQQTIADLIAAGEWNDEGRYLRAIQNKLIVRHTPAVHREIYRLLIDIGAMAPAHKRSRSFGCGSVIPVVGQRDDDLSSR